MRRRGDLCGAGSGSQRRRHGQVSMAELRAACEACGFTDVRTLQAAGNVVLRSGEKAPEVKRRLEASLASWMGKPVGVPRAPER